jgi:hypothetical protein
MYSAADTRCRVGCPIRISTDQRLLAAPRGFSQRATSFIASWCQGIHRMPFSRSRSTHHAQEPSTPSGMTTLAHGKPLNSAHTCGRHRHHERQRSTTPLNEVPSAAGSQHFARNAAYRSDMRPTARPETHQNLIHPDKDHGALPRRESAHHGRITHDATEPFSSLRRKPGPGASPLHPSKGGAFAIHSSAWGPGPPGPGGSRAAPSPAPTQGMETIGFEPTTPCLQSRCSPS